MWLSFFLVLFSSSIFSRTAHAVEFHNKVSGEPVVECMQDKIKISVETTSPGEAPSRIFAKGQSFIENCNFLDTKTATFSLTGCNMNRQRQLNPRGLHYSLTIVVQLHPLFVTKVDRAYNVKCFYMEADKIVTSSFDVSMLTTSVLESGNEMPNCIYGIHSGTRDGPLVRYAQVGDKVYHVWNCPSDIYGMLVHSCYVEDGQGNRIQILDQKGCETDKYVMRTPNYSSDLSTVEQETHVFKFADRINVRFNCQIKLCLKEDGGCNGVSPPICDGQPVLGTTLEVVATTPSQLKTTTTTNPPTPDTPETETPPVDETEEPLFPEFPNPPTPPPRPGSALLEKPLPGENGQVSQQLRDPSNPPVFLFQRGGEPRTIKLSENLVTASDQQIFAGVYSDPGSGEGAYGTSETSGWFPRPALFPDNEQGRPVRRAILSASRDDPIRALLYEQEAAYENHNFELDIQQEMLVLEPDDKRGLPEYLRNDQPPPAENDSETGSTIIKEPDFGLDGPLSNKKVCLSSAGFGLLVSVFIIMMLASLAATVILCIRHRRSGRGGDGKGGRKNPIHTYLTARRQRRSVVGGGISSGEGSCGILENNREQGGGGGGGGDNRRGPNPMTKSKSFHKSAAGEWSHHDLRRGSGGTPSLSDVRCGGEDDEMNNGGYENNGYQHQHQYQHNRPSSSNNRDLHHPYQHQHQRPRRSGSPGSFCGTNMTGTDSLSSCLESEISFPASPSTKHHQHHHQHHHSNNKNPRAYKF